LAACSDDTVPAGENVGQAEVALTNTPNDVKCVRLTVEGPSRTDVRKFSLTTGQRAVFKLQGLPVGKDTFSADAFNVSCDQSLHGVSPTWYSEPVVAELRPGVVTHVTLKMIRNGRATVGIDFGDDNGPSGGGDPPPDGGVFSSEEPFVSPVGCPVRQQAVFTVGDGSPMQLQSGVAAAAGPGGGSYRLVGAPDGLGAFDNGDGTFTLLVNHGLGLRQGVARAHGGFGAFISKWTVRSIDLAVLDGSDLIQRVNIFDAMTGGYREIAEYSFQRFGSGDLPDSTALFDPSTGLGFDGRLFFNGEQAGSEGRAWAHDLDGTSYELPRMGKANWENIVPNPQTGRRTVVIGSDDADQGTLFVYIGEKTGQGLPIVRAGLTNGGLFGVRVKGVPLENLDTGIPDEAFDLFPLGNVEAMTGAELHKIALGNGVTGFLRPQDGAWDPNNPNDFYFVSTAAFEQPSRLFRLRFADIAEPERGGVIETLLDGTEGQHMLESVALDRKGHVYIQEDPGANEHLAKIWRYDVASDQLSEVARPDAALFSESSSGFVTNDEETAGMIDMSEILGAGRFLLTSQVHFPTPNDPELGELGQISMLHDNDALGNTMAALATLMVECTGTIGPDSFQLDPEGFLVLPQGFRCTEPLGIEGRKDGEIQAYLSLQYPRLPTNPDDPKSVLVVPNGKECIAGRWRAWREAFDRTGIKQDQCPRWSRIGEPRLTALEDRMNELARVAPPGFAELENPEDVVGKVQSPKDLPDLERFKVFRDFEVFFENAAPNHPCTERGPAACAAVCAGAFPGFVVDTTRTEVTVDAMEWLEDFTNGASGSDQWIQPGYFHNNWEYGETHGNRNRARWCYDGPRVTSQACNNSVDSGQQWAGARRACTTTTNCASELCSVPISGTEYKTVRFRLSCTQTLTNANPADIGDEAWEDIWNDCVSHCYLGP
jgi:hypothetical protein